MVGISIKLGKKSVNPPGSLNPNLGSLIFEKILSSFNPASGDSIPPLISTLTPGLNCFNSSAPLVTKLDKSSTIFDNGKPGGSKCLTA